MPKRTINVKGLSTADILNIDFSTLNKLSATDLRAITARIVSTANKRLKSFERAGERSPASRKALDIGRFSVAGKNINELRAEFVRVKSFLESKTGSVRKWRKAQNEVIYTLANKYDIRFSPEQFAEFWETYEKLKELSPSVATRGLKYNILQRIADELDDKAKSPEDIAVDLSNQIDEIYQEQEKLNNASSVSKFFKK